MQQEPAEGKSRICVTFRRPACPFLPEVAAPLGHMVTRIHAPVKGEHFYLAALRYAQSLWREGKPAQAILQLNKAFMADLRGDEEVLQSHPPPYAALMWLIRHRQDGDFIGNPVRHFQHLATRVSGERREIRSWRAWGCFHLSREILPVEEFPEDHEQIAGEGVEIPEWQEVVARISAGGWAGEERVLGEVRGLA